jgi:hypothetical protein
MYAIDANHMLPHGEPMGFPVAVSEIDGSYIGNIELAEKLKGLGIAAQARPGGGVASIGFCESEQKWYGWSHRAMCGFGVGSKVAKGDCAYVPADWNDLIEDAIRFWSDPGKLDITAFRSEDDEGRPCAKVQWINASDADLIPNTKLHGQVGGSTMYPPAEWGRGEWVAESLEDARQMACDFAEGVG